MERVVTVAPNHHAIVMLFGSECELRAGAMEGRGEEGREGLEVMYVYE